jgi:hypothetical protein
LLKIIKIKKFVENKIPYKIYNKYIGIDEEEHETFLFDDVKMNTNTIKSKSKIKAMEKEFSK